MLEYLEISEEKHNPYVIIRLLFVICNKNMVLPRNAFSSKIFLFRMSYFNAYILIRTKNYIV